MNCLAYTGATDIVPMIIIGVLAMGLGVLLVVTGRKRGIGKIGALAILVTAVTLSGTLLGSTSSSASADGGGSTSQCPPAPKADPPTAPTTAAPATTPASTTAAPTTTATPPPTTAPATTPPATTTTPPPTTTQPPLPSSLGLSKAAVPGPDVAWTVPSPDGDNAMEVDGPAEISWTFLVANTGQTTLTNVTIDDQLVAPAGPAITITCPTTTLDVGQDETCTSSTYTVTQDDAANLSVMNNATASGTAPDGSTITSNVASTETDFGSGGSGGNS